MRFPSDVGSDSGSDSSSGCPSDFACDDCVCGCDENCDCIPTPCPCNDTEDCGGACPDLEPGESCECIDGKCTPTPPECVNDSDCPEGICINGKCTPTPPECSSNEDCPSGICVDGKCVPECTNDSDCPDGICINGKCVPPECSSDEDCPNGICVNGRCVPPECSNDNECPNGICVNGRCVPPECSSDDDCPEGICIDGRCVTECTNDSDCPDGEFCINGKCTTIPCNDDNDCPEGTICINGFCELPCQDCSIKEVCVDNKCVLPCEIDSDCPIGFICENNICVPGCLSDEDCESNQICINGRCADKPSILKGFILAPQFSTVSSYDGVVKPLDNNIVGQFEPIDPSNKYIEYKLSINPYSPDNEYFIIKDKDMLYLRDDAESLISHNQKLDVSITGFTFDDNITQFFNLIAQLPKRYLKEPVLTYDSLNKDTDDVIDIVLKFDQSVYSPADGVKLVLVIESVTGLRSTVIINYKNIQNNNILFEYRIKQSDQKITILEADNLFSVRSAKDNLQTEIDTITYNRNIWSRTDYNKNIVCE